MATYEKYEKAIAERVISRKAKQGLLKMENLKNLIEVKCTGCNGTVEVHKMFVDSPQYCCKDCYVMNSDEGLEFYE